MTAGSEMVLMYLLAALVVVNVQVRLLSGVIQVAMASAGTIREPFTPAGNNGALEYHGPALAAGVEECNRIYADVFDFTLKFVLAKDLGDSQGNTGSNLAAWYLRKDRVSNVTGLILQMMPTRDLTTSYSSILMFAQLSGQFLRRTFTAPCGRGFPDIYIGSEELRRTFTAPCVRAFPDTYTGSDELRRTFTAPCGRGFPDIYIGSDELRRTFTAPCVRAFPNIYIGSDELRGTITAPCGRGFPDIYIGSDELRGTFTAPCGRGFPDIYTGSDELRRTFTAPCGRGFPDNFIGSDGLRRTFTVSHFHGKESSRDVRIQIHAANSV
ncbi:hypothetical protein BV898_11991 [Hypsibius exemplaris]|uniref:Uncharacterized protein n=1 Tax=Hypsibius exemplaris TaxID=2072580 RepID=A0A1W0WF16_HYPEX|nr:hypothetical protein BV898_11991 [Hypsibius exemplaris]